MMRKAAEQGVGKEALDAWGCRFDTEKDHNGNYHKCKVIVMDYIDNTLYRAMNYIQSEKKCWVMTIDVVKAVCTLHVDAGIKQKDIKSNNLMVDRQDRVVIIDFGRAKGLYNTNEKRN